MTLSDNQLHELHCFTCGRLIGLVTYEINIYIWCCEGCANTPISRAKPNQARDELIIALFFESISTRRIAEIVGATRQGVQSILDNRGVSPFRYASREEAAS